VPDPHHDRPTECYETSSGTCAKYPSGVQISDIHYVDVTGAGTKSKEVETLLCSEICADVTAMGTSLVGTSGESEYF
jgi:galacturan 1,4-alpha-galacturonidase